MIDIHKLEFSYLGSIISLRGEEDMIEQSQVCICKATTPIKVRSILPKDNIQNLPEQCPLRVPLRLGVLAHDTTRY